MEEEDSNKSSFLVIFTHTLSHTQRDATVVHDAESHAFVGQLHLGM